MKTLKFSCLLLGLLFFVNMSLEAQKPSPTPNISMESISVGSRLSTQGNRNVTIVLNSNIPYELVVTIYVALKTEETGRIINSQSSGNITTDHTFEMEASDGAIVELRCGYIDGFDNYQEMEGGCTITIEPGFTYP